MRFDDSIFAISSVVSCKNLASSLVAVSCDLSASCRLRQHTQTCLRARQRGCTSCFSLSWKVEGSMFGKSFSSTGSASSMKGTT